MPKRIPSELPPRVQPVEEELTEEEMDDALEDEANPMPVAPRVAPRVAQRQPAPRQLAPRQPVQPAPPVKAQLRYNAFKQEAAEGIVDVETGEVIAADMYVALANIMERLERIEQAVGSMLS